MSTLKFVCPKCGEHFEIICATCGGEVSVREYEYGFGCNTVVTSCSTCCSHEPYFNCPRCNEQVDYMSNKNN